MRIQAAFIGLLAYTRAHWHMCCARAHTALSWLHPRSLMPAPPVTTDGHLGALTAQLQKDRIARLQGQITNSHAQQGLQLR